MEGPLGLQSGDGGRASGSDQHRVGRLAVGPLRRGQDRSRRAEAMPACGQGAAVAPGFVRPHGPAAQTGRSGRLPRRHLAERLRTGRGSPARLPAPTASAGATAWLDVARYADTRGYLAGNESRNYDLQLHRTATGSSKRASMPTCPTTSSSLGRLRGTCCRARPTNRFWRRPSTGCTGRPTRVAASRRNSATSTSPTGSTRWAPRSSG